ncbi:MAG: ATP-grasp domain-containing protein, partial [Candidatus Eremiobacteraeota bacterium]|nr:ATP-grasp domain-containing protein [Candidatus Eremiobacteraeota bacterium]
MNCIFLSPHFPPHFYLFCASLKKLGANVLGIADSPYEGLSQELKDSLTEYYRVDNMEDYDQLLRAAGFYTHKYGKIDRVNSHNEHWLETEARLRTDFNIHGIKLDTIQDIKLKSRMKKKFIEAGVPVARGRVVTDAAGAVEFAKEVGFPIIAKPDNGVGASNTAKLSDEKEVLDFFASAPRQDFFAEEFIDGEIVTFDGLTDREGKPLFYTSHTYRGMAEALRNNDHIYYYSLREIPEDLVEAGLKAVKIFDVREIFFHIEFFRKNDDGGLIALEVNMRPPGGFTTDMIDYANDMDVYCVFQPIRSLIPDDPDQGF